MNLVTEGRKKRVYDVLNAYLENGLKVVLHKIPGVKTISCGIWIKQGSIYETDENNGLSHLLEHLILNADNIEGETQWNKKSDIKSSV